MLYGTSCVNANSSPTTIQKVNLPCNDQGSLPASKRHRTADVSKSKAMDDVFCDHEDFTADDLEEIDILASQALTQDSISVNVHQNQGRGLLHKEKSTFAFPQTHKPALPRPERVSSSMFSYCGKYCSYLF